MSKRWWYFRLFLYALWYMRDFGPQNNRIRQNWKFTAGQPEAWEMYRAEGYSPTDALNEAMGY